MINVCLNKHVMMIVASFIIPGKRGTRMSGAREGKGNGNGIGSTALHSRAIPGLRDRSWETGGEDQEGEGGGGESTRIPLPHT